MLKNPHISPMENTESSVDFFFHRFKKEEMGTIFK